MLEMQALEVELLHNFHSFYFFFYSLRRIYAIVIQIPNAITFETKNTNANIERKREFSYSEDEQQQKKKQHRRRRNTVNFKILMFSNIFSPTLIL